MKNKKMPIIAVALLAIVGVVGATIAYFTNSETFENLFSTKTFSTTIKENFESPENWVPGATANKTVEVKNEGNVKVVVRAKIDEETKGWYNGNTKLSLADKVTIHYTENSGWQYNAADKYYYYMSVLGAKDSANDHTEKSFIESVTFDADATIADTEQTCTYTYTYKNTTTDAITTGSSETAPEGTKVISKEKKCTTNAESYAGATYKMSITVETVQADSYKSIAGWEAAPDIV